MAMARIKPPFNFLFLILIICSLTCEIDSFPFPVLNSCEQKPTNPVCAVNGRTFRNQCCLDLFNRNGAKRGFYLAKAKNGPCNRQRGPYRSGLEVQGVYNNNGYYPNVMPATGNTVSGTEFKAAINQVAEGHDKYNNGFQNSVYNHKSQNSGPPVYGSGFYGAPTDLYQVVQQQKPKPSYNNNYGQDQDQDQSMKTYQVPYNYLNNAAHHAKPSSTSNNGNGPIYSYNYGIIKTTAKPLTTPCPAINPTPVTFPAPVLTTLPPIIVTTTLAPEVLTTSESPLITTSMPLPTVPTFGAPP